MAVSRCNCKDRNCGNGRKSGALSGWNLPVKVLECLLINVGPFETGRFCQRLRLSCNQNCGGTAAGAPGIGELGHCGRKGCLKLLPSVLLRCCPGIATVLLRCGSRNPLMLSN